ncbi:MAG: OmpH family outer membrane protein [Chitinophagaceae bacterium]
MNYIKKIFTIVLLVSGLLITSTQTKAQMKIGYVNTGELLQSLPEAKKADSLLNQFREVLDKNGKDYQEELETKAKKFNDDSTKLTPVVKEAERKKLQDLYSRIMNYSQEAQKQLEDKQQELLAPLQKKTLDIIQQVAKDNGYTHVFNREALLVVPTTDDLLPLIKKKLNLK